MENGNFKVKCIKDTMNMHYSFKAIYGKVYEFKNGIGYFENNTRTNTTYQTAKEFLRRVADEWFEIYVEENTSIHIYPNKTNTNETIAILKQGKEVIKTASTICNPADEYYFNKGAEIAFNRLLGVKETTQKPMEVKLVKRKAKVGEWVKIVNARTIPKTNGVNDYNNGSIIQIIGIEDDCWKRARYGYGYADNYTKRVLTDSEYVVLENYNQLDLSTITNEQLIAELTNRLGGK